VTVHVNNTLAYLRLIDAPQSIIDNVAALATERDKLLAALRFVVDFYEKAPRSEYPEPTDITVVRAAIAKVSP
jgi:hypothetical protein